MCKVFRVNRSGYYHWRNRKPAERTLENERLKEQIAQVYQASKKRYGSPKITIELRLKGIKVSRPRVARIMKKEGIKSIVYKKFRVNTTDSNHPFPIAENHLNRQFTASEAGEAWVSDITYIPTQKGWLYLTTILDLYDRKVVGWALSDNMTTTATTLAAWSMACRNRPIVRKLLFHSDRGVQYAAHEFRAALKDTKITQSMSRKGNCWDNAVAESFFKILKSELVNHRVFTDLKEASREVFEFIEVWYNRQRIHSALGFMTPEEFGKKNQSYAA
jgi:putative transposase